MTPQKLFKHLTTKHIEELTKLRKEGYGRRRLHRYINDTIGKAVTHYMTQEIINYIESQEPSASPVKIIPEYEEDDDSELSIDDLIKLRVDASHRKMSKSKKHKRTLILPNDPIGILVFGDPHVDNEGCDWSKLYNHVMLAKKTKGVLASCVGDMQDNWIGRLARLYCNSSVTASDGWRLSEWLLESLQWIALVGGNHDSWAHGPGVDPLKILTDKSGVMCYAPDELRITLKWRDPTLDPVIWVIRHDFKGRSWFHATHGPNKEAMLDGKCHILTAGHIHQWGQLTTEQRHGRITHAIRVRGYKRNDSFAREKGFHEQEYGEAALIVINPRLEETTSRIMVFWDIEEGCKYLTSIRKEQDCPQ